MPADENFPPDPGEDHTPDRPSDDGTDAVSGEDTGDRPGSGPAPEEDPADEATPVPGAEDTPDGPDGPPDADAEPETEPEAPAEVEATSDAGAEPEAEAPTEDEVPTEAVAEPDTEAETPAEVEAPTEAVAEPEAEPEAPAEVEATSDAGPEPEADAPSEAEEPTEPEASSQDEVPTEAEAAAEAETPSEGETPTGTEPETPVSAAATTGAEAGNGPGTKPEPSASAAAPRRRRARRVVLWVAASLVLVLGAGVATAFGYYHSLRAGMVQHDLESVLDEADRPDRLSDAVNILFIGSDGYEEGSTAYSQEFEGERSDSIMLAHISPDNRVSVISFPRDSLVQLPECDAYAQTEGTSGYFGMINAAMYHGGPPCVVRTIESLTEIRVDHFVHLSFMSFRDVVDAIGGVRMCIPEPMSDRRSHLDIDAGDQVLDGDEALSFVRARYEIGDGGDIGRIDRQQMFLGALADQVTSSDVLTSPSKLNGVLEAVAQHSATDQELTLNKMLSVAVTLTDVDLSDIEFHTVPWYQAPYDPNRVMWYPEESEVLFSAVREGRPLPPLPADEAGAPQEPPGASPTPADTNAEEVREAAEATPDSLNGGGRDATSNPCADGLGFGAEEDEVEDR